MPNEPITETGEPKPLWPAFAEEDAAAVEHDAPQTVTSFPRTISGQWVFDPDRSEMPALSDIDIQKDIIVKIEPSGEWLAAAPLIQARVPNSLVPDLSIALRLAVEGRFSITDGPDALGRFQAKTAHAKILEEQYAIGGDNKARDMTAAVGPFLRMALAEFVGKGGTLSLSTDHDDRLLTLTSSSGTQVFRRPTLKAKFESLRYVNDHKQVRKPTGFDTPEGVAKGTSYADPGEPVSGPHYTRASTAAASFTQSDTIVAEVGLTIGPVGTKFRLIGRCPGFPFLCFESEPSVAAGSPQFVLVQAKQRLPAEVLGCRASIQWHAQGLEADGAWANLGESGPHMIYSLIGPPLPGPSGRDNHPTALRLNFIMDAVRPAGIPVPIDPHNHPGQQWTTPLSLERLEFLMFETLVGSPTRSAILPRARSNNAPRGSILDVEKLAAMTADQIWGLLDLESLPEGLVGEAMELLSLMIAMIGIPGFRVLPTL
jgi:hypothetical protein